MTGFWICLGAVGLLAAVYLAALCPWRRPRRGLRPGLYAHRGLHGPGRAENSLEAFQAAAAAGYGVELDVRLSADGAVVIFHDDTLMRACGQTRGVEELSLSELKGLRLFGTPCRIPTLEQALEAMAGRCPLIVEIKPGARLEALCEKTAALLEGYPGPFCVESFDPRVLYWFRRRRPQMIRGQLSMNFFRAREGLPLALAFVLTHLMSNFLTRPDFIAYRFSDRQDTAFSVCRQLFRMPAAAWTVTEPSQLEGAQQSFDAVIFEGFRPKDRA